jgi:TM2 domain-containing membrane protein YozV
MRNKYVAIGWALLFGYFGIQKFYLGKIGQGLIYVIFCWTFIPLILSFIEAIQLLLMSSENFDLKYNQSSLDKVLYKEKIALEREKLKIQNLRLQTERIEVERKLNNYKNTELSSGQADELAAWNSLLEQGLISKEEYEEKRKNLLGIDAIKGSYESAQYTITDRVKKNIIELNDKVNIAENTISNTKNKDDSIIDVTDQHYVISNSNEEYNENKYLRLGDKYKPILNLSNECVLLLNNLSYPDNNFNSIEFCRIEIIKLFTSLIYKFNIKYISEGKTIDLQFQEIADLILNNQLKSYDISQILLRRSIYEKYSDVLKHCENTVREYYGIIKKINVDSDYSENNFTYQEKTHISILELHPELIKNISLPDENTEIELNLLNPSRWKIKYEELKNYSSTNPEYFYHSIVLLGKINIKNSSVENIFYEASKCIANYNKEISVKLYIHYVYHDLSSKNFDNKQLTKSIYKTLFSSNEEIEVFEEIVNELKLNKDLDKALSAVPEIYEIKRRKIQLDSSKIKEVQKQHTGTVELLNEYLKEESIIIGNQVDVKETIQLENYSLVIDNEEISNSLSITDNISFNDIQIALLELFKKNNFIVQQIEVEEFIKSKGGFKNQVINSINENCFEVLDDILIEEDSEYYKIDQEYFNKISSK